MNMTVSNTMSIEKITRTRWLVTQDKVLHSEHGESISFSVAVPISESSVGEVQQQAIRRAIEMLSNLLVEEAQKE